MMAECYYRFWAKAFDLSLEQIRSTQPQIVCEGHYVSRHGDEFIFFYQDLLSGKKILAASPANQEKFFAKLTAQDVSNMDAKAIRNLDPFKAMEVAFSDIDYCLNDPNDFIFSFKGQSDIRKLSVQDTDHLNEFYSDCSEDDKDTLDLEIETDFALGLFEQNRLSAVARYVPTKTVSQVLDLTMLVRNNRRGEGLSTVIMSELVEAALKQNLWPKYRVKEDNFASIAVAKKMNFKPTHRLLAWKAR